MTTSHRRVFYATEARLHRGMDGRIYSDASQDWYENHLLWLNSFDEVMIVARVEDLPRNSGRLVEGDRVRVLAVPSYQGARGMAARFMQIRKLVRQFSKDATAVYGGRFPGVIGGITVSAGHRLGARTFAHVVGDPYDVLKSGVAGRLGINLAWLAKLLMARQVSSVDGAIYVSERTLQRRYPVRAGAASLVRSGLAITDGTLAAQPKIARHDREGNIVVAVGTHNQMYKGHDLLLRAAAQLRSKGQDITLELVGGGVKHPVLVELAKDLGIDNHVTFHGHVETPEDVRDILDRADLFAMPSRTEGVPRALIEAMARGLPCIGSNIGGIPELLPPDCLFASGSIEELTGLLHSALNNHDWMTQQAATNLEHARQITATLDPQRVSDFFNQLGGAPKAMERT
ncbi:glycosyltransferase [Paenarthrobacter sp. RAF54_2]|uniref:glycosyltransferase n=1 Tax=Paenarthrobacter sp. RAF54_2 TaxID=3233061 RepID=UPI003F9B7E27